MTYYSLLAIFPALAALVAVYGLFADPSAITRHLDQVAGVLPGGAIEVAQEQLTRVASKGPQTLGLTFLVGLGVSLWSANAAMKSLFDTLNIVYGEEEKRGFVKLNAISLLFTVGGIVFVVVALGAIVVIPVALKYISLSEVADLLLRQLFEPQATAWWAISGGSIGRNSRRRRSAWLDPREGWRPCASWLTKHSRSADPTP